MTNPLAVETFSVLLSLLLIIFLIIFPISKPSLSEALISSSVLLLRFVFSLFLLFPQPFNLLLFFLIPRKILFNEFIQSSKPELISNLQLMILIINHNLTFFNNLLDLVWNLLLEMFLELDPQLVTHYLFHLYVKVKLFLTTWFLPLEFIFLLLLGLLLKLVQLFQSAFQSRTFPLVRLSLRWRG